MSGSIISCTIPPIRIVPCEDGFFVQRKNHNWLYTDERAALAELRALVALEQFPRRTS